MFNPGLTREEGRNSKIIKIFLHSMEQAQHSGHSVDHDIGFINDTLLSVLCDREDTQALSFLVSTWPKMIPILCITDLITFKVLNNGEFLLNSRSPKKVSVVKT